MRVVECDEYGGPDVLHLAARPIPPLEPGKIRLRVHAAAVNPADVKLRQGMFHAMAPFIFPQVLGYDVAGTVDACGPGVTNVTPGQRVFAMLNPLTRGAYAEYVLLPAGDAMPLPAPMDFATAVAIPTGGLTGVQMIEEYAKVQPGDVVLITGATGSVGRFAVHAARQRGARIIAAVRAGQREDARAIGADATLVLDDADSATEQFDYVIDTVGGGMVAALCRHLKPGGAIFTASTTPIPAEGLSSTPVFVVVHNDPARLAALAADIADGKLAIPIGKRLKLAQAAEAHRLVEAGGNSGKIILEL